MPLTAIQVKQAGPREKPCKLADGVGFIFSLNLLVGSTGATNTALLVRRRHWRWVCIRRFHSRRLADAPCGSQDSQPGD